MIGCFLPLTPKLENLMQAVLAELRIVWQIRYRAAGCSYELPNWFPKRTVRYIPLTFCYRILQRILPIIILRTLAQAMQTPLHLPIIGR